MAMTRRARLRPVPSTQPDGSVPAATKVLRGWIECARFPLHSRLPAERELAGMLQLSRARLRVALKLLETEGRIWRRVGVGTFVGSSPRSVRSLPEALGSATTLAQILEARSLIEPVVAHLAAQRAETAELAMIEYYSQAATGATDWAEWERWDELLHRAIAEASGNGLLISIVDQLLRIKIQPKWTLSHATTFDRSLTTRYASEHRAVIAHIIGRDGGGAEAAMRRHMLSLTLTVGPAIAAQRR